MFDFQVFVILADKINENNEANLHHKRISN